MFRTRYVRISLLCTVFVVPLYIIQVHRFADEETGGIERIADMQFGIFGFKNGKTCITFIVEDTASIRQPRHLDFVSFLQVVNMNTFAFKGSTLDV